MNKTIVLLIALLIGLTFFSSIASALTVKPSDNIPLKLTNYKMTTSKTLYAIIEDWRPEKIRWRLIDPSGNIKSTVDSNIDSTVREGIFIPFAPATWVLNEDSGFIEIPAFSQTGTWKLNALFFDKGFLLWHSEKGVDISSFTVTEASLTDNLMAPLTYVIDLPVVGSYTIAIDVIYLILIIAIIPLIILIFFEIKKGRKEKNA